MVQTSDTGLMMHTVDGAHWWFDSGSPALDFAHTGSLPGGTEQLHSPADLGTWLAERFPRLDDAVSEREVSDALLLRNSIARLAVSAHRGEPLAASDVDVVNLVAALPDIPPSLAGGSRQAGATHARASQALSTLARATIALLESSRDQIRVCADESCGLLYLDTSRSGSRRWCSMQRCGNRAKVRAFRERRGDSAVHAHAPHGL